MSAHHSGVEHLNQMRRLAHCGERLEKRIEDARLAQSQNRFQTLFQFPNSAGSARQVML
jgi:hypothetical protein